MSGWIHEIFSSIQGEGLYCGQQQAFVRLAGCNLACDYCDTLAAREPNPPICSVEIGGEASQTQNPMEAGQVVDICRELGQEVISVTGGEPLLQVDFLGELMQAMTRAGFLKHLETNGTLYRELASVVKWVDVVAMDMKLPSAAGDGAKWDDHAQFLEIASATEVFVKTVVSPATSADEICQCCDLIAAVDRFIPLVIQPVTGAEAVSGAHLIELCNAASQLANVRVIPQCHKILNLR